MRYKNPELRELLAAEYALGTLKGRARQRFEGLMQAHPALRKEVRGWEERLHRLGQSAPPVAPPAETWQTLEHRLFPPPAPPAPPSWFERLGFWRGLSLSSGLAAVILAVVLVIEPPRNSPGYVVMINDSAQKPVWMVSTSADMGKFYIKNLKAMDMPRDVQCLLWVRPEGSQKLYALGVLPDKGDDAVINVDKQMRALLPGELLVSVEHGKQPVPDTPESPLAYEGKWLPVQGI